MVQLGRSCLSGYEGAQLPATKINEIQCTVLNKGQKNADLYTVLNYGREAAVGRQELRTE